MLRTRILVLVLTVFGIHVAAAMAEEYPTRNTQQKPEVAAQAQDGSDTSLSAKVKAAWRILPEDNAGRKEDVWLGQAIRVKVENFDLFRQMLCEEGNFKKGDCKERDISLFLNRMELKGVRPRVIDDRKSELEFQLLRREALPAYLNDPQQKFVWATLFGFQDKLTLNPREVEVSVGPEGGKPLESSAKLNLVRIQFDLWSILYIIVVAIMIWTYRYAGKRGAFNDRGPLENDTDKPALSLALVQMGFWFFLVVASFLFIWMVIGELPGIPASILGLIGIASGTALGAAMIDTNKRASADSLVSSQDNIQNEIDSLKTLLGSKDCNSKVLKRDIDHLKDKVSTDPALQGPIDEKSQEFKELTTEIHDIHAKIAGLKKLLSEPKNKVDAARRNRNAAPADSWLQDLLADANGISFHRLQMAIWTLVLGIVFIQQVVNNLALPDFDTTLLALMGISSGTYLGFKLPEQQLNPQAKKVNQ